MTHLLLCVHFFSIAPVTVDEDGTVMTMKQIQELQKRLATLEEENQILKKAIAIFTPHSK